MNNSILVLHKIIFRGLSLPLVTFLLVAPSLAQTSSVKPSPVLPEINIESYQVNGKKVKLFVSVKDKNQPLINLPENSFELKVNDQIVTDRQVTSLQQSPTPTKIIFLLDVSGSMETLDESGVSRKKGAIEAIQRIQKDLKGKPVSFNLILFGEGNTGCKDAPAPVLDQLAQAKGDESSLTNKLKKLEKAKLCAATDLYNPLLQTLKFLKGEQQKPANESQRFAIILFSDGFHSHKRTCMNGKDSEPGQFEELKKTMQQSKNIPIYTIGYGVNEARIQELVQDAFKVNWRSTDASAFFCKFKNHSKYKEVEKKFLDGKRLREIAELGNNGGEYKQSDKASEIAATVQNFISSIIGKYELDYTLESARAGESHNVVVGLTNPASISKPQQVTLDNWAFDRLPKEALSLLTVIGLAGASGWAITFQQWAQKVKKEGKSKK